MKHFHTGIIPGLVSLKNSVETKYIKIEFIEDLTTYGLEEKPMGVRTIQFYGCALEDTLAEIKENDGDCHIYAGDITNPETVRKMFVELKSHYGAPDICVNSAGTAGFGFIQDFPVKEFQKIMKLNLIQKVVL